MVGTDGPARPRGFFLIGAFFVFGATMAGYAAVTLLEPGTFLDALWTLNQTGHAGLLTLGTGGALLFVVVCAGMVVASVGWFRRRLWGWRIAVAIVAINMVGDIMNFGLGERLKGTVGVLIAGLLLIYISRSAVRDYFSRG
jgi:hypothetical protein